MPDHQTATVEAAAFRAEMDYDGPEWWEERDAERPSRSELADGFVPRGEATGVGSRCGGCGERILKGQPAGLWTIKYGNGWWHADCKRADPEFRAKWGMDG